VSDPKFFLLLHELKTGASCLRKSYGKAGRPNFLKAASNLVPRRSAQTSVFVPRCGTTTGQVRLRQGYGGTGLFLAQSSASEFNPWLHRSPAAFQRRDCRAGGTDAGISRADIGSGGCGVSGSGPLRLDRMVEAEYVGFHGALLSVHYSRH